MVDEKNIKNGSSACSQWWKENSFPVCLFSATWLWLYLLSYITLHLFPLRTGARGFRAFPENLFLDGWVRWDSGWYYLIVEKGYTNLPVNIEGQKDTVFFPLYPALIRLLKSTIPDAHICGLIISNVSFLIALILLYRLVISHYNSDIAKRTLILIAVYPFSFFYRAMYTESLFLLMVVCTFYFGERKRWIAASLFAAAAGATRVVGIAAVAALIILYLEQNDFSIKKIRPDILWISLGVTGPGSFIAYLGLKFGDPLIFIKNQNVPGWNTGTPLQTAWRNIHDSLSGNLLTERLYPLISLSFICLFFIALAVCLAGLRKMPASYSSWALLTLALSFFGWRSLGRYSSVIFPMFIAASLMLSKEWFYRITVYISLFMLTVFTILFTHSYWVS